MKTLTKKVFALVGALSLAALTAPAGMVTITANASNGSNYYDGISSVYVPAGAYCSYNEYVVGVGTAQVQVAGPGININNTIYSGSTGGGGGFSSAGNVSGSVYASTNPGSGNSAHASLTIGW